MSLPKSEVAEYGVFSCGADWLTCTAKNTENAIRLERLADVEQARQRANGYKPLPQNRMGFTGWKAEGIYFGRREHDVMLQLSGATCDSMALDAIQLASNVSRFDLQTTIYTEGEVVHLAADTWRHLKSLPAGAHRPRSYSLIVNHPAGQTCYINKRSSDCFGRIYDKGVESQLGPAGLLWRYEVELKRDLSQQTSSWYVRQDQNTAPAANFVHQWMTSRGARPPWAIDGDQVYHLGKQLAARDRTLLSWFESNLSKTVQRAVSEFGLSVVLRSLGLQELIDAEEKKRNGNL